MLPERKINMSLTVLILLAIILLFILKYIFNVNFSFVYYLIINVILGVLLVWFINYSGVLYIPINSFSKTITGIFGVPGVMGLSLMALAGML